MSEFVTFRIKFEKTGNMKYISHLDLNRLFSRALARAGVELAHSEGFNPHPKISFASALSLGMESLCEFADAKIVGLETDAGIIEKTKGKFPPGINIVEVYEPGSDFKNIDRARYHISVKPEGFGIPELEALFSEGVSVEKKPGVYINLSDYIRNIAISGEAGGYILIDAVLAANPQMYLNPENMIKAINSRFAASDYFLKKIENYDVQNNIFR